MKQHSKQHLGCQPYEGEERDLLFDIHTELEKLVRLQKGAILLHLATSKVPSHLAKQMADLVAEM